MKDFFISYDKADRTWAEWIAWQLEDASYSVTLQAWDFGPGSDFMQEMDRALKGALQTIAVLSPDYLQAKFAGAEWRVALAEAIKSEARKLLPVLVRECELKGLLSTVVYIDLIIGKDDEAATKDELLAGVKSARGERGKPQNAPSFPGVVQRSVTTKQPRFPGILPSIWNVPHNRNPNFTGRDSLITKITNFRTALTSGQPAAMRQAISGLGGVGKTQLAVEYAYRYATEYDVVWWARAEEPATLASDYASLAFSLGLPEKDAKEQTVIVQAVRRWLGQNQGWLLVLDNADDPTDIHDYLPQGTTGQVLITSRNPNWGGVAIPLSVKKFERSESVKFLCKRTGQSDEALADKLADTLGDLPLALAQAGAYIEETSTALADYLELFRFRRNELWSEENPLIDYPDTVGTTWSLSMEQVRNESPAGVDLFSLCSYLGSDDIPRKILTEGKEVLPQPLSEKVTDTLAMNKALSALRRYSLIEVTGDTISIHRLVEAVVRDMLAEEVRKIWAEAAVGLVNSVFPYESYDVRTWQQCSQLLPHALASTAHAEELEVASEVTGRLLNQVGMYLIGRAQFAEAEKTLRQALARREQILGLDHTELATSLSNLAALYYSQGRYAEAEPLYKRALEIREKALGQDHPDVAQSLNNLALLYYSQGKDAEAEPIFKQALTIFEKALGPNHINVAKVLENMAELYEKTGRKREAEELKERAKGIRSRNQ